jgi:hypothetical protein
MMETEKKELGDKVMIHLNIQKLVDFCKKKILIAKSSQTGKLLSLIMYSPRRVEVGNEVGDGVAGFDAQSPELLS